MQPKPPLILLHWFVFFSKVQIRSLFWLRPIGPIKTRQFKLVWSSLVLDGISVQSNLKNSKIEVIDQIEPWRLLIIELDQSVI